MVNQDKASKQIALLRQEIQQLTLEVLEYKQGKRVADSSGVHMTDTYHELDMLRNENENLRMRIKALQKNIDSQTIQLTELKVSSALACFIGGMEALAIKTCSELAMMVQLKRDIDRRIICKYRVGLHTLLQDLF